MAAAGEHATEAKSFAPKNPPRLAPPKDDPISLEVLTKCNGTIDQNLKTNDSKQ